jgi:hypothetical protein
MRLRSGAAPPPPLLLTLVCALLWCGGCEARFVVEKNSLSVTAPAALKGAYECAIGNFGVPQYGGTMVGVVAYPKANRKACKGFDDFDISYKAKPGALPTFLLVDRGGEGTGFASSFWLLLFCSACVSGYAIAMDLCFCTHRLVCLDTLRLGSCGTNLICLITRAVKYDTL